MKSEWFSWIIQISPNNCKRLIPLIIYYFFDRLISNENLSIEILSCDIKYDIDNGYYTTMREGCYATMNEGNLCYENKDKPVFGHSFEPKVCLLYNEASIFRNYGTEYMNSSAYLSWFTCRTIPAVRYFLLLFAQLGWNLHCQIVRSLVPRYYPPFLQ